MAFLKTLIFIISLLILPVSGFLIVLHIVIDIVRDRQEEDERGF